MRRLAGGLFLAAVYVFPALAPRFWVELAIHAAIMVLFAVSFNLLLGYTGLASFGQAAYFSIGAYGTAILLTRAELAFPAAMASAILLSAFAALVIGFFCVRLTQIYFAMLTLAYSQIIWAIAFKWNAVTGGDNGFVGIRVPAALTGHQPLYLFTVSVVLASVWLLWRVVGSPFGRLLTSIRENPERAEFLGINVRGYQLLAFVIAGAFAGLAGALFALHNRSVFPDSALWTRSAEVLIMTILGGVYTFLGPAVGAVLLVVLDYLVTTRTEYWPLVLGSILLALVYFFPEGVMGTLATWRLRGARRGPRARG